MTNKMNINVSGGNVSLGAVSQGNATTISGTASITQEEAERHFQSAEEEVRRLGSELQQSKADVDAALAQVAALKKHASEAPEKTEDGEGILKTIRENFSWAYPAIKDFAKAVWPALLVAIGS